MLLKLEQNIRIRFCHFDFTSKTAPFFLFDKQNFNLFFRDSTMEALSDGHTVSPLIRVGYLHARRGAKTYFFHFAYQTKDSEYPQVS
jgi:Carboxylesterase family